LGRKILLLLSETGSMAARKTASAKSKATGKATRPAPSTKPLWAKLHVKGGTVLLANAPSGIAEMFEGSPATLTKKASNRVDTVLLFVNDEDELRAKLAPILGAIGPLAHIWIAYRKGEKALHRDTLAKLAAEHGLQGVALVAVNAVWSALRVKRV
jgi:hypothetical protein